MSTTTSIDLECDPAAGVPAATLDVRGLTIAYGGDLDAPTVQDVSFQVRHGQTVAVVGESGSGKSTIVNAVLKLLDRRVAVAGTVRFGGRDVLGMSEREFRGLRGRRIGYVPQDPTASLNPVRRIGTQIFEAYRTSRLPEYADRRAHPSQAAHLLDSVGIVEPERALRSYPHQLSGGQLQRVLIGIAIAQHPELIVADEPTSALDVTMQKSILDLIDRLKAETGLSVLFVTHDLSLAAERSDTVVVLDGGRVQEQGPSHSVLRKPTSSYTRRLVADVPSLNRERFVGVLTSRAALSGDDHALRVDDVHKTFHTDGHHTAALQGVSFTVPPGRTHALVGESGSGKSTLARIVLRLVDADAGAVSVGGRDITRVAGTALREVHRNLQLVYQNPFTSLDPTYPVGRLVDEPLRRYRVGSRSERRSRAAEVLALVGLDETYLARRTRELSGGQRQRVAIARALTLNPKVLVLDEPTSALDVSVQAQILEVLIDLQARLGLSYLFISHDLSVVRQVADTVTVLRRGRVQERGATEDVFTRPATDYTRTLVDSVPRAL